MPSELQSYRQRLQDSSRAVAYASRFESGSRKRIDRREQRAVGKVFALLGRCRSILDVPCGAGRFAATLRRATDRLIEADVSGEILALARDRHGAMPQAAGFFRGDASRLPLSDGAVDCVFCNRLLHHLPSGSERRAVLKELGRVAERHVVVSFFDYHSFLIIRRLLKRLKGRKPDYERQPTLAQFAQEAQDCGLKLHAVIPTGAPWVAQKFAVLTKVPSHG